MFVSEDHTRYNHETQNQQDSPNVTAHPAEPVTETSGILPDWNWQGSLSLSNFRHNCEVLRPRAPELVQQLESCPFPPNFSGNPAAPGTGESKMAATGNRTDSGITEMAAQAAAISVRRSRDGHWVLHFRDKPLYSRYRPLEECRKWIEKDLRKETNAAIFAGFGLGYQIEELLRHRSKALILLVEPGYALFKAALCLRDLSGLLSNTCFFCSVGPAANLELYLHHFSERNFQFYQLQALYNCQHKFYQPLQRRIFNLLSRFRINTNTLNRFGRLWVRNMAMNLRYVADTADVAVFYQRFRGLPFLLIAAGPSLEALLPSLDRLRQRFVLLAVDTALGLLLRQGIEPDFVVSVDPQLLNARHFDFCESPNSILVSESCIYPTIFQRRWGFRALFHSHFPLMERLEKHLAEEDGTGVGRFGQVRSGGSVATAAWDFARNCKASALYVAGLDLSYPTLRSHCPGTLSQSQSLIRGKRLEPIEHINWRVTISAGARQVDSWQGPELKVLSDKRMNVYRNWLEESLRNLALAEKSGVEPWPNFVIDGSEGHAAKIKGMKLIRLEDALKQPECRPEITQRIDSVRGTIREQQAQGLSKPSGYRDKLLKALDGLLREVRDIHRWSAELLALLCYNRRSKSQQKRLQELQGKISRSPSRSILSFFFTETLSQMVGRSPEQLEAGQPERERLQIYQRFYLSSKFHIYWLEIAYRQLSQL
ncbi:DUF115 domain-containing protein [Candidatus Haliotispira prima]|uniref:DUF115 domain-containing protein n=1 Tax=Candidatus Haliotispira prima TaxID=3034016 RepID=A0ABY8MFL4_9SPIO|nr:DUF115 domain-containing protein [Candidatus Haliotispira prima]